MSEFGVAIVIDVHTPNSMTLPTCKVTSQLSRTNLKRALQSRALNMAQFLRWSAKWLFYKSTAF